MLQNPAGAKNKERNDDMWFTSEAANKEPLTESVSEVLPREYPSGWRNIEGMEFAVNGGSTFLKTEWNRLSEQSRSPLVRYEWYEACAAAFYSPDDLLISVLYDRSSAQAILPLAGRRIGGIRYAEILGSSVLFEPAGFLYENRDALKEAVRRLVALGNPLKLTRLMASKEEDRLIRSTLSGNGYTTLAHRTYIPWMPLETTWEKFEASMSSSRRSSIRRGFRRLSKTGAVEIQLIRDASENLSGFLDAAFRIEASSWKGTNGTAIERDRRLKQFFLEYSLAAARAGILRLFILRVGGEGAAMVLAVEYASRLWILKVGYDERWAFGSPGVVLMHETIKWAFSQKLEAYEFLGRDEPWIHIWTNQVHECVSYRSFPRNLTGILWFILETARTAWLKISRRRRPSHHD